MLPLLRGAGNPPPAPIRGLAHLLRGGNDLGGGRTALRLLAGRIPRAVPRLSPRETVRILRNRSHRPPRATQEEPCARADRGAAYAELHDLRDQPDTQGAEHAAGCDCRARDVLPRGLCSPAAPAR